MTGEPEGLSFVEPLRHAAQGKRASGVELLRAERPPLLDGRSVRAVLSVLMAAFMVGAAILRTRLSADVPFDLMALLLRTAALAFVVRALLAIGLALRKRAQGARTADNVLAWSDAGIYERTAHGEHWFARADVLAVVQEEQPERSQAQAEAVWLVARPERQLRVLELTAHYTAKPEILAARLARWVQPGEAPALAPSTEALSLEARYARAAGGKPGEGEVCVPEGVGYRLRAPFAALLGIAFALDALWTAGPMRARILGPALLSCLLALALFAGWFVWMGRRRATRLGIAMLITPGELLVRGHNGVIGVPWVQLSSVQVVARLSWSPFVGSFAVRTLVITTTHGEVLSFDGGFLGVAPEVLAALLEAYRAGRA
jgi:hypothetical protein